MAARLPSKVSLAPVQALGKTRGDIRPRSAGWFTRGMNARGEWQDWVSVSAAMAENFKKDVSVRTGRREVRELFYFD